MWPAVFGIWQFRGEILAGMQLLASLRRSSEEVATAYIEKRIRGRRLHYAALALLQVAALTGCAWASGVFEGPAASRVASGLLWGMTLVHGFILLTRTRAELAAVGSQLRRRPGYEPSHLWRVAFAIETLQWNATLLTACVVLGISPVAPAFSYWAPWAELLVSR